MTPGLKALIDAEYVEVTWPLGNREVVTAAAYRELPVDSLSCTKVRALTRAEVVKYLAWRRRQARRGPS